MENVKSAASKPCDPTPSASQACDLQACLIRSRRASKLPADVLLSEFAQSVAHDRANTVELLIQMGAIETRQLYSPLACGSMYAYCTEVMRMSESAALKRIRAARAARRFPAILPMIAQGQLHLSAVSLLARHLTHENVNALLAQATHMSKSEVERLVARHFPKPDVATMVRQLTDTNAPASTALQVIASMARQPSPGTVVPSESSELVTSVGPLAWGAEARALNEALTHVVATAAADAPEPVPGSVLRSITEAVTQKVAQAIEQVASPAQFEVEPYARVTPRSPGRFAWQLTADQDMQDLLEEARQLLGHEAPGGDLKLVLKRGLEILVQQLRKSKHAETSNPRAQRGNANSRHVPHAVVRAVTERDGHQCTFESPAGRRCSERSDLELDHIIPFARGGKPTVDNLRWLCRRHNQHEAERVFGSEHMQEQRKASRARAGQARAARRSRTNETAASRSLSGPSCGPDSSLDCAP